MIFINIYNWIKNKFKQTETENTTKKYTIEETFDITRQYNSTNNIGWRGTLEKAFSEKDSNKYSFLFKHDIVNRQHYLITFLNMKLSVFDLNSDGIKYTQKFTYKNEKYILSYNDVTIDITSVLTEILYKFKWLTKDEIKTLKYTSINENSNPEILALSKKLI